MSWLQSLDWRKKEIKMVVPPPGQVCVMDQGPDEDRSPRGLQQCLSPTSLASRLEADEGKSIHDWKLNRLKIEAYYFFYKIFNNI